MSDSEGEFIRLTGSASDHPFRASFVGGSNDTVYLSPTIFQLSLPLQRQGVAEL